MTPGRSIKGNLLVDVYISLASNTWQHPHYADNNELLLINFPPQTDAGHPSETSFNLYLTESSGSLTCTHTDHTHIYAHKHTQSERIKV